MNRVLKRPMFRIGGSAGTGITSGLDQPQKMAKGGRIGYQQGTVPNFQMSGLPGFLTSFGLNLLATPPQGNIFQTAATAARDPFNRLQVSEARRREIEGERAFKTELLEKELKVKKEIAAGEKDLTVNQLAAQVLDDYQNDLNKATNHAKYFIEERPLLAKQYGETQMGGLIEVNLNDPKSIQRSANLKKKDIGKIFYELNTGSVLKLIRDPASNKLTFTILDKGQIEDDTGDVLDTTKEQEEIKTPRSFEYFNPKQKQKLEELGEEFSSDFYQG